MTNPNIKFNAHIMSDLHLEHKNAYMADEFFDHLALKAGQDRPDYCILAGDITALALKDRALKHLKAFANLYKNVIYVPGNHEFYGTSFDSGSKVLEEISNKNPNVHVLGPNKIVTLNNQRFVGDTMWFPEPPWNADKNSLSDYRAIKGFIPRVYELNKTFVDVVIPSIQKDDIIVTHHMPFNQSVATRFKGDPFNAFFLFDCSKFMSDDNAPKLWVHGHTHDHCNYNLPINTMVYCNPMGYPFENANPNFWNQVLV